MFFVTSWPGFAADNARQIVEEAQKRTDAKSQRYEGLLQVFDAKGKISDKRWTFDRIGSHGDSKSVLRFTTPAEVKGVALLVVNHPDRASDQWMWTPAIERDRRIALQDRSTRFFGTDFSFEDLEERDVNQYDYALVGDDTVDGVAVLEDSVDAEGSEVVAVHAVDRLGPQGQLRVRADRELRQGSGGPAADLFEHRERAGHLDRAPARDDRSASGQPHAPHARQAAVQRPDERRRLHPPGDPAPVKAPAALLLILLPQLAAAQTVSQRGFVDVT